MRKLVSVQEILDLSPIPEADKIEIATVLGWKCVVKKGDFQVGDKCVYFEIDSLLPVAPWTEFLRKGKDKPYHLKTVRLRGQISQGLVLRLSDLPALPDDSDLSEFLGVTKFEPKIPAELVGVSKGNFPSFLRKTEEMRLQSNPELFERFLEIPQVVGTVKMDGTSATYYVKDGVRGLCTRNMELVFEHDGLYKKVGEKLKIWDAIESFCAERGIKNLAVQGEICGPSIQGNPVGLKENTLFVFDLFDIDNHEYISYLDVFDFCIFFGINFADDVFLGPPKRNFQSPDCLFKFSEKIRYSPSGKLAEGVVWRGLKGEKIGPFNRRLSFKTINNSYLLGE